MKKQQALLEMQMQQIEEVATQVPIDTADSCDLLVVIETVHASCHMLRFRGGESLWWFIQHRKLFDNAWIKYNYFRGLVREQWRIK